MTFQWTHTMYFDHACPITLFYYEIFLYLYNVLMSFPVLSSVALKSLLLLHPLLNSIP